MVTQAQVKAAIKTLEQVVCEAEGIGSNSADRLLFQLSEIQDELMEYAS